MSVSIKRWKLREFPPFGFSGQLGLTPFHAHLLYNRGIRTREDASLFIQSDERQLNDPALLPEMDEAVARLRRALADKEYIGVYGDFDADGITGTALL